MVISHGTPMTFGPSLIPIIEVWYLCLPGTCIMLNLVSTLGPLLLLLLLYYLPTYFGTVPRSRKKTSSPPAVLLTTLAEAFLTLLRAGVCSESSWLCRLPSLLRRSIEKVASSIASQEQHEGGCRYEHRELVGYTEHERERA